VKDIFITVKDRQRNKKISQNKIPIMEIFSGLNPENLKFQIIPPVYLILEFQFIGDESNYFVTEKGANLQKDDLEMKFEFRLSYDKRKSMVSKLILYIIRCNDKLYKNSEEIKHQAGVLRQVFDDYSLFEDDSYGGGVGSTFDLIRCGKDRGMDGCGMEQCRLF
jgi:hypothetical protein